MARQKGPLFLDGITVDNIIYYKSGDQFLMRKKPGKGNVKQTAATKQKALLFGKASKAAKIIYTAFRPLIPDENYKLRLFADCRKAVLAALNGDGNEFPHVPDYKKLFGINFIPNRSKPYFLSASNIFVKQADGHPVLTIPSFNPKRDIAPEKTVTVRFRLMALVVDIMKLSYECSPVIEIDHEYTNSPTTDRSVSFSVSATAEQGLLLGLQMCFLDAAGEEVKELGSYNREFSGIVGVVV